MKHEENYLTASDASKNTYTSNHLWMSNIIFKLIWKSRNSWFFTTPGGSQSCGCGPIYVIFLTVVITGPFSVQVVTETRTALVLARSSGLYLQRHLARVEACAAPYHPSGSLWWPLSGAWIWGPDPGSMLGLYLSPQVSPPKHETWNMIRKSYT